MIVVFFDFICFFYFLRRTPCRPLGLTKNDPTEPKRAVCVEIGLEPRPQFHEKDPQREKKERNLRQEKKKKKKTRNFGLPHPPDPILPSRHPPSGFGPVPSSIFHFSHFSFLSFFLFVFLFIFLLLIFFEFSLFLSFLKLFFKIYFCMYALSFLFFSEFLTFLSFLLFFFPSWEEGANPNPKLVSGGGNSLSPLPVPLPKKNPLPPLLYDFFEFFNLFISFFNYFNFFSKKKYPLGTPTVGGTVEVMQWVGSVENGTPSWARALRVHSSQSCGR